MQTQAGRSVARCTWVGDNPWPVQVSLELHNSSAAKKRRINKIQSTSICGKCLWEIYWLRIRLLQFLFLSRHFVRERTEWLYHCLKLEMVFGRVTVGRRWSKHAAAAPDVRQNITTSYDLNFEKKPKFMKVTCYFTFIVNALTNYSLHSCQKMELCRLISEAKLISTSIFNLVIKY